MIPVTRAPEPRDFNRRVRRPGHKFLRRHRIKKGDPAPMGFVWRRYWSRAILELHVAYRDICAYSACYLHRAVDRKGNRQGSVEHFIRKAENPWLAYEWTNFLLADRRLNSSRDHSIDPITCPYDLDFYPFQLFLESGMIDVSDDLTEEQEEKAYRLLDALHLDHSVYDRERAEYYARYADRNREDSLSNKDIARYAPFIWYEIQRQGLVIEEEECEYI